MKIGIVAEDNSFSRFYVSDSIVHIKSETDLSDDIKYLIINLETALEFSNYFLYSQTLQELVVSAKKHAEIILYVPDYSPNVCLAGMFPKKGANHFDDINPLIHLVDCFLIGDEQYLGHAKSINGSCKVLVTTPFINPKIHSYTPDQAAKNVDRNIYFDELGFAEHGYINSNQIMKYEVESALKDRGKKLHNVSGLTSISQVALSNRNFWLCINNHYYSEEYIPRRYLEIIACGGLVITNYTKAVNKYLYSTFVYSLANETMRVTENYCDVDLLRFKEENAALIAEEFNVYRWYANLFSRLGDEHSLKYLANAENLEKKPTRISLKEKRNLPSVNKDAAKSIAVIYPIYNNGKLLYYRSIRSLLRSSVFNRLQIYLVDDGSTDCETIDIINELTDAYDNIVSFFFSEGGSGSASRPRNKGLATCQEDWVAYEDPDNESIGDAYATYLETLDIHENFQPDVISSRGGYAGFIHGKFFKHNYPPDANWIKRFVIDDTCMTPKEKDISFRRYLNTHTAILRKSFIINNNLSFAEECIGEDNLISLQAQKCMPRVLSVPYYKCLYYAETADSLTNTKDIMALIEKWLPATNEANKILDGEYNIHYLSRNILAASNSVYDSIQAIDRLGNLYDGTPLSMQDDRKKWLMSFIREDIQAEERRAEYFEQINSLSFIDYIVFNDLRVFPVICNEYPSEENIYANAFIHSRLRRYKDYSHIIKPVVIVCSEDNKSYYCYEGIPVITLAPDEFAKLLRNNVPKTYVPDVTVIHFMSKTLWDILKPYHFMRLIVFVHGFEIQDYDKRRPHILKASLGYEKEIHLAASRDKREFWRKFFEELPPRNIKLVFVAKSFYEEVLEDLAIYDHTKRDISVQEKIKIIHNVIDTDFFTYQEKPIEHRFKILSIRSYMDQSSDTTYATDLIVKAILWIKERYPDCFKKLSFTVCGGGERFNEINDLLIGIANVSMQPRFLTRSEIRTLHAEHGLFLIPSRSDTQGVSRDEAMASGLIPITSNAGSILEFVDESCAVIAPYGDFMELAEGIVRIANDSDLFMDMSKAAADCVRKKSSPDLTVAEEVKLIYNKYMMGT